MIKLKDILLEALSEGVYDPGILKAVFLGGGPGSGKSFISNALFGIDFGRITPSGLKPVNSDMFFEFLLKKHDIDSNLSKLSKQDFEKVTSGPSSLRNQAKTLNKSQLNSYIDNRLGLIMDGTGANESKLLKTKLELETGYGYDTFFVFVNTSLEKALERNRKRDRVLPDKLVKEKWESAQDALAKYKRLFGSNFVEIVNNEDLKSGQKFEVDKKIEKQVDRFLSQPVQNKVGKKWIADSLAKKNRLKESFDEYKIYCDMDGVLCNFEKQWIKYFNKDANEHRREIGKPAYDELLDNTPFDFWAKMEWQPGGKKLWNTIKSFNPSILSAPADSKASEDGKKAWVAKHLKPQPEVIFRKSNRKQEFASSTSILIDDHESNIRRWKAAGGIAIHHTDINKTLAELNEYLNV